MKPRGQYNQSGKLVEIQAVDVAIASGAGSVAVAFGATFLRPPHVSVVPHETDAAAGATYAASSITATGFTLTVTDTNYPDGTIKVEYFAAEMS